MPSTWIEKYPGKRGVRFRVNYRLGGRASASPAGPDRSRRNGRPNAAGRGFGTSSRSGGSLISDS